MNHLSRNNIVSVRTCYCSRPATHLKNKSLDTFLNSLFCTSDCISFIINLNYSRYFSQTTVKKINIARFMDAICRRSQDAHMD